MQKFGGMEILLSFTHFEFNKVPADAFALPEDIKTLLPEEGGEEGHGKDGHGEGHHGKGHEKEGQGQ